MCFCVEEASLTGQPHASELPGPLFRKDEWGKLQTFPKFLLCCSYALTHAYKMCPFHNAGGMEFPESRQMTRTKSRKAAKPDASKAEAPRTMSPRTLLVTKHSTVINNFVYRCPTPTTGKYRVEKIIPGSLRRLASASTFPCMPNCHPFREKRGSAGSIPRDW